MSSHNRMTPIRGDFCADHLRFVMSCSDAKIAEALAELPDYDLARLRRVVASVPLSADREAQQKEAS